MRKLLDRSTMKLLAIDFALVLAFVGLAYFYLYPGSEAMIDGRVDTMMSDGTDPASLPHAYDLVIDSWKKDAKRLFFGSVYVDGGDPDHGAAFWMPWNERWLIVFNSWIFPVEQIYTANVFALLLLNGLCMFLLGRYLGWSRTLAYGAAIAWAFTAYTRARAKVHGSLAGIYHLPLIFLGLFLVVRGRSKKSLALAALSLLLAGTVAHYYLVVSICVSPLFVVFVLLQPEFKRDWKRVSKRFVLAVVPLMAFLAFNRLVPLPSDVRMTSDWLMEKEMSMDFLAPSFMRAFSAKPIDYVSGDISLATTGSGRPVTSDLNPLREMVNDHVIETMTEGNPHERTNGIRWLVLGCGLGFLVFALLRRKTLESHLKTSVIFFGLFGFVCFWMSLSPDIPFEGMGLSAWVNAAFSKIRVPSRSGIGLAFGLLMLTGFMLSTLRESKWKKVLLFPGVFPALMVLDYYPLQDMPMAPVEPAFTHLKRENGHCGPGMFFPFVTGISAQVIQYQMTQRLRGSDCTSLNSSKDLDDIGFLVQAFPASPQFLQSLERNDQARAALETLARCVPLNWIAFHPATPPTWATRVCQELGWSLHSDGTCIAPDHSRAFQTKPVKCFGR